MRVTVIGSTGRVGSQLVAEALERHHEVTGISRHAERASPRAGLHSISLDVTRSDELVRVLAGQDALVSAFNPGWKDPDIYDDYLRGARSILAAARTSEASRIIWIGGAGSLFVAPGLQLVDTPEFPRTYRAAGLAARETLRLFQQERVLDWAVVSPAVQLEDGPRTAVYRVGTDAPVVGAHGVSRISVADLAVAVVDEVERPRFHRRRFTVGY